jgi:hypothetical protein
MRILAIAAAFLFVLGVVTVATLSNDSVADALSRADGYSQLPIPSEQITADARGLRAPSPGAF